MYKSTFILVLVVGLIACSSDTEEAAGPVELDKACNYTSPFTMSNECRSYDEEFWEADDIKTDCDSQSGTLAPACPIENLLGRCVLTNEDNVPYTVASYGDASGCDLQKAGCENFGGGAWVNGALCDEGGGGGGNVFIQPTKECRSPLPGEPEGESANGEVCTWQAVAGSTEEGRRFSDYASCGVVRSQRPYYPIDPAETADETDPRMNDPEYVDELNWVTSQIEASACVCCHSEVEAPLGTSSWFIESPGNWLSSMEDTGVALGANAITSIAFGAFPPLDNNGFNRIDSGIPSTDPTRMVAFFENELTHRGLSASDFTESPAFGGPLHDQIFFQPSACQNGEGVDANGNIAWDGGDARYIYIMETGGERSPTVPPNLDLPAETLWRIDVPSDGTPVASGSVAYGTLPSGLIQTFPEGEAPDALVTGQEYYLYVSLDVGIPVTRCTFTQP